MARLKSCPDTKPSSRAESKPGLIGRLNTPESGASPRVEWVAQVSLLRAGPSGHSRSPDSEGAAIFAGCNPAPASLIDGRREFQGCTVAFSEESRELPPCRLQRIPPARGSLPAQPHLHFARMQAAKAKSPPAGLLIWRAVCPGSILQSGSADLVSERLEITPELVSSLRAPPPGPPTPPG